MIIAIEGTREYGDSSCVDAFCKLILHCRRSEGWDQELGQALEIIPHTRPYGLRAGSIFSGMVKVDGEPMAGVEIEFEEFNETPPALIPEEPLVTGVAKTDANGNFQVTLDREGWWGIAAHTQIGTVRHEGKELKRSVSAYFWIYVHPGR